MGSTSFNLGESGANFGVGSYRKNRSLRRGDCIVRFRHLYRDISRKRKLNFKPQTVSLLSSAGFCCRRTQCNGYFGGFRESVPWGKAAAGRCSDARCVGQRLSLHRLIGFLRFHPHTTSPTGDVVCESERRSPNSRRVDVEKSDAVTHGQSPVSRLISSGSESSRLVGFGLSRRASIRVAVSSPTGRPVRFATMSATRRQCSGVRP